MKDKYRLIALDLDDTLLDKQKKVSTDNIEALEYAEESGVEIAISTGRNIYQVDSSLMELPGIRYCIACNGARIYDIKEKRDIYLDIPPFDEWEPLMKRFAGTELIVDVMTEDRAYRDSRRGEGISSEVMPAAFLEYLKKSRDTMDDMLETFIAEKRDLMKMVIILHGRADDQSDEVETIKSICGEFPEFEWCTGSPYSYEVTKKGVNKGRGLLRLAEMLGIPVASTMAIGDSGNDLSMIKAAGMGVAMANSTKEVLEAADYITTSQEESGVAAAIRHFI